MAWTRIRGTAAAFVTLFAAWDAIAGDTAQVPESLRNDPAYATYAKIQIQLDMLANPSTAASIYSHYGKQPYFHTGALSPTSRTNAPSQVFPQSK